MQCVARDPDITVLILGESGTGKERIARAIHRTSPRRRSPFEVVNCAGLSASLVEDELFGHVRGAFTGAVADRPGPFERAEGGTVLLDEVGELPFDLQMKLLRALQQRSVLRLGARHETAFDIRVIAATNVDLARATMDGRFREDLYYRLKVYVIRVPPLRERVVGDLADLSAAILRRLAERRRGTVPLLDVDVLARLSSYPWPGNVRELENTLECMLVIGAGEPVLGTKHLPVGFGRGEPLSGAGAASVASTRPLAPAPSPAAIRSALERHSYHRRRAAADLALSRHQLYRLIKQYGLDPPASDE
jgi:transcriptional regulator with PAS, ATPase and Fis domain